MNYKIITITKESSNSLIGNKIMLSDTFLKRFLGLIPFRKLDLYEGMLLTPCNSIHMMFMNYSIDAIFLDKHNKVCAIYKNLKPWFGITKIHKDANSVLELNSGSIDKLQIKIGELLKIN